MKGRKQSGQVEIPGRVDISKRPKVVEKKSRIGDWEGGIMAGTRDRGALVVMVDRASKYTVLARIEDRTAEEVVRVLSHRLGEVAEKVLTVTVDNKVEFAGHAELAKILDAKFYFATPGKPYERGLNEHVKGLVRGYLPKGTDFLKVSDDEVQWVEDELNSRPRKALGYLMPKEVFSKRTNEPVSVRSLMSHLPDEQLDKIEKLVNQIRQEEGNR